MAKPKANPARQSRVFAYCRYSSEAQDNGNSIETQRATLNGICKAEALALTGFIVDKATSRRQAPRRAGAWRQDAEAASQGGFRRLSKA
jgi:hypothetical protein